MDIHHGRDASGAAAPAGAETSISHVIPSVELKGSRTDKLETLDRLIAYLERLRKGLAGETEEAGGGFEGPSRYIGSPVWPWFSAGVAAGGLFVLLMLFARSCA